MPPSCENLVLVYGTYWLAEKTTKSISVKFHADLKSGKKKFEKECA